MRAVAEPWGAPVAASPRTAPVRLTVRGRVLLGLALAAVIAGGVSAGRASISTPAESTAYEVVTIAPGQTLWSIARQHAPSVDPRLTVERIVSVNGLVDADDIRAGAVLSVPVAG